MLTFPATTVVSGIVALPSKVRPGMLIFADVAAAGPHNNAEYKFLCMSYKESVNLPIPLVACPPS